MAPTWTASGQYYETCSCDFVCPCVPGQMAVEPTKGSCTVAMAFQIERGRYGEMSLDGLGFIVLGRLLWDPRIMGADVGTWPIFNWLLLGYGAPAAALLAAGHILKRDGEDLAVRICDALGVLFAGLFGLVRGGAGKAERRPGVDAVGGWLC